MDYDPTEPLLNLANPLNVASSSPGHVERD